MGAIDLNVGPQSDFFLSKAPSTAAIAGFGSGKTFAAFMKVFNWLNEYPGVPMGYFAPTYSLIRDIFVPEATEFCSSQNINCEFKASSNKFLIQGYAPIICRSMQNPETIVGFQVGNAAVDEIDILSTAKAWEAWRKIKARCRVRIYEKGKKKKKKHQHKNQMALASTPEGFKFAYEAFKKDPLPNSELFQMSTYSNERNLPEGYIEELMGNYPPQLVDAYIRGIFTNLQQGTVYTGFDRFLNDAPNVLPGKGERIYVGMDFNVQNMSSVIHVIRDGKPIACGEIAEVYDTPSMIESIDQLYPRRQIIVYPDATGGSRNTTNASLSDLKLLRDAGFIVRANHSNPAIKDRVNSMNAMFLNAKGERRYYVNVSECPRYVECLEQQPYDSNGLPDKDSNLDHLNDAAGYFIEKDFGISRPISRSSKLIM